VAVSDTTPAPGTGISGRTLAGWIAVSLVLVVLLSVAVGYAGPSKGFQWELASVFGTALGTTLLAAATGALAYSTWGDLRATWQLANLTKRDQDERERPVVLVQSRSGFGGSGSFGGQYDGSFDFELRNVGLGPALGVTIWPKYSDESYGATFSPNPLTHPSIAPNETVPLRLGVFFPETSPTGGIDTGDFELHGTFSDRSRRRNYEVITALSVYSEEGGEITAKGKPVP
jgi:hypothetical protein